MEDVKETKGICGVCGSGSVHLFGQKYREYSLWTCTSCGVHFWMPMKNPGAEWYEKDEKYSFRNAHPLKKAERNHKEFLRDMPARGGRLLDIGMGTGNFLAAAVARGYDGYGIDFDRDAIRSAEEWAGLKNVYVMDVEGACKRFGPKFFDIATIFEVLEHLENPRQFIGQIRTLLKPGGYLAVSVPYRNTWKPLFVNDLPPRHLTRWDIDSLRAFLVAQGFSVVRVCVIPVRLSFLITKFHFWARGIASFNTVQKLWARKKASGNTPSPRSVQFVAHAARAKDYLLFTVPAALVLLGLFLIGKQGLGLYALVRKTEYSDSREHL